MSSLKYWIWLSSISGIGPVTALQLLKHFGTPEKVYQSDVREYRKIENVKSMDFSKLVQKNLDIPNKVLASCQKLGYRLITLQDAEYPDRLKNIYDPPLILYVRGNLPIVDEEAAVAVVGTRNCTPYGITSADNMGYQLAQNGILVVTGLARGIDTAVARGALRGEGRVLGVIGSGLDVVYPPENASLFDAVAGSGAIICEYPPGTSALRVHFPARNRILSGLSLGVAVIEAPKKSGALITASRALEQGRDVFTLPGNVDARSSEGSNSLLREGAIPILSAADIISEYEDQFPDLIKPDRQRQADLPDTGGAEQPTNLHRGRSSYRVCGSDAGSNVDRGGDKKEIDNTTAVDYIDLNEILITLTGDEKTVAEMIGTAGAYVDDIITGSGLAAQQVLTALTMLEINGHAQREGSGKWKFSNLNS